MALPLETQNLLDVLSEQLLGKQREDFKDIVARAGSRGFMNSGMTEELLNERRQKTLESLQQLAAGVGTQELAYNRQREEAAANQQFQSAEAQKSRTAQSEENQIQRTWQERINEQDRLRQADMMKTAARKQMQTALVTAIPGLALNLAAPGIGGATMGARAVSGLGYLAGMGSGAGRGAFAPAPVAQVPAGQPSLRGNEFSGGGLLGLGSGYQGGDYSNLPKMTINPNYNRLGGNSLLNLANQSIGGQQRQLDDGQDIQGLIKKLQDLLNQNPTQRRIGGPNAY